jgi:outer membrane protein OmpA-like peptidoglycan-associated protein
MTSRHRTEAPVFERPVFERPVFERPVFERPVFERPAFERPAFERPAFERPAFERPPVERPPVERPPVSAMAAGWAAMLWWIGAVGWAGCGATTPIETVEDRFDSSEASEARDRAPDMYAAAQRAHERAVEAEERGDRAAAADHATRARLLLDAAVAEADRLVIEERRLSAERSARRAEEQTNRDTEARQIIERELAHREAARVALEQATLAFDRAAADEGRRYARQAPERQQLHQEAAAVLRRRAELLLASARALGASNRSLTAARAELERSGEATSVTVALRHAERAVRMATAALGDARETTEVGADQRRALVEEARAVGFAVEQLDQGLAVRVDSVFTGRSARPTGSSRNRLGQLAALLRAHPQGPVLIRSYATRGTVSAREGLASQRAAAAIEALTEEGVDADRLQPQAVVEDADPAAEELLEALFLGFGPH